MSDNDSYKAVLDDFIAMFTDAGIDTLNGVAGQTEELATLAAQRTAHLAPLVGEPGFTATLQAEADAMAMKAGIAAVTEGRAADARVRGLIEGAMRLGARALRLVAGDIGAIIPDGGSQPAQG